MTAAIKLSRSQILAFRRQTSGLDERLPRGRRALRRAAWAGLQDSMPRAALLSIHARMSGATSASWEDPSLVQIWGPRFSTYVVAERDVAVFTVGRLPDEEGPLRRAHDIASRLRAVLKGNRVAQSVAAQAMRARHPNEVRYAAPTGTVLIRWDGARQADLWSVPAPELDPRAARLELARRYLHAFGPATPEGFENWAGISSPAAIAAFDRLGRSLAQVRTPIGDAWILAQDEALLRAEPRPPAPARLLPSGDTWFLLQGAERALLVPNERHRGALWTSRVWPGALLVDGETVGTWRRADNVLSIQPWRRLSRSQRAAVEAEASSLPLPRMNRAVEVKWDAR